MNTGWQIPIALYAFAVYLAWTRRDYGRMVVYTLLFGFAFIIWIIVSQEL